MKLCCTSFCKLLTGDGLDISLELVNEISREEGIFVLAGMYCEAANSLDVTNVDVVDVDVSVISGGGSDFVDNEIEVEEGIDNDLAKLVVATIEEVVFALLDEIGTLDVGTRGGGGFILVIGNIEVNIGVDFIDEVTVVGADLDVAMLLMVVRV